MLLGLLVASAVVAQQLLPLRSILGLNHIAPCTPAVASVRYPDNAPAPAGRWELAERYPEPRDEVRAATADGRVYVGTGVTTSGDRLVSLDEIFAFDPQRESYETIPAVPSRVDHAAFVGHRGMLYVIGGYVDGTPTGAVWRFSPGPGVWESLPPMHIPRGSPAAAAIGDKIYVVGGSVGNLEQPESISDLEIYDLASKQWTRGPGMPTARHHHAAAATNGRLVVVGGRRDGDLSVDAAEQFDPATGQWFTLPPLPSGAGGLGAVAAGGRVVVVGGGDDDQQWVTPATWALDRERDAWRRLADLNVARHGLAAAAVGPTVYVFGGAPCPGYGRTDVVESLDTSGGASQS
jgi:N-acetylneuraminic acid mutarotase